MPKPGEHKTVQARILEYAEVIGWTIVSREDAEPVSMDELLRATVSLFNDVQRDDTPDVVLDIAYAPGAHPYQVVGHDSRLHQVVVNLLENAISFSPPGGQVTIAARRIGNEIQISVEDEGPGIPQENIERVFERFYTDRPEESFGQNSGLGLNISRQIVVAHGGRLYVENREAPDTDRGKGDTPAGVSGGARFVIRLPAA